MLRHGSIMSPVERNQALGITTHQTRRQRGDLIYIYKMFESGMFTRAINSRTRGHSKKLRQESLTTTYESIHQSLEHSSRKHRHRREFELPQSSTR